MVHASQRLLTGKNLRGLKISEIFTETKYFTDKLMKSTEEDQADGKTG